MDPACSMFGGMLIVEALSWQLICVFFFSTFEMCLPHYMQRINMYFQTKYVIRFFHSSAFALLEVTMRSVKRYIDN